jgi:antitoxin (DNA-binding transcriptional repressor) of toxin-antitoxin stability system
LLTLIRDRRRSVSPHAFDRVAAFMHDHWDLITDDESAYKPAYVAEIADVVRRADAGEVGWDVVLTTRGEAVSHLIGWRAADHLRRLARAWPGGLATGVRDMLATQDADALWRALLADAGGEAGLTPYRTLASVGARASVASYFLFVHDPVRWPMYRADNFGTPLVKITGEPLDKTSPASLLRGYYRALDELHHRLRYAGLPATSRLDAQGVLWVANYKRVV